MSKLIIVLCFLTIYVKYSSTLNLISNIYKPKSPQIRGSRIDYELANRCLGKVQSDQDRCKLYQDNDWGSDLNSSNEQVRLRAVCCGKYEWFNCTYKASKTKCNDDEQDALEDYFEMIVDNMERDECRNYEYGSRKCVRDNTTQPTPIPTSKPSTTDSNSTDSPNTTQKPNIVVIESLIIRKLILGDYKLSFEPNVEKMKSNEDKK